LHRISTEHKMDAELHNFKMNLNELFQDPVRERGHITQWIRIQIIQRVISYKHRELATSVSTAAFMLLFAARGLLYGRKKMGINYFFDDILLCFNTHNKTNSCLRLKNTTILYNIRILPWQHVSVFL